MRQKPHIGRSGFFVGGELGVFLRLAILGKKLNEFEIIPLSARLKLVDNLLMKVFEKIECN